MQNLITNGTTALSDRVATAYKELFSDLPVINGQVVYPQMPDFQLTYFIQQALDRHYLVRLQFKAPVDVAPTTVIGTLKEDAAGHLILKQSRTITTIVSRGLLRSVQRAR
ncbi:MULTISPECIES: hypothetical protein [Lactobacillaceae]|uniref:hypothetical protein n=1 Tax=Lactobacillaceae TaxID=33958 RepID=UPI0014576273|nr:hypothetical protein [Lactobacillus sp. HBUAS51381]NLR09648.1 hypothetical protein [Lactobacillus sp. HBUAS51381]